jgi:hypothetical protein
MPPPLIKFSIIKENNNARKYKSLKDPEFIKGTCYLDNMNYSTGE